MYSEGKFAAWPGAEIQDVTGRLPQLVESTDYYPLLHLDVGTNVTVKHNLGKINQDFRVLVAQVTGTGAQVIFSFILPVRDRGVEEVDTSCRSTSGFVAGVITRALASMIRGHSLMNTNYWGEMGSTYLEEEGESLLEDWLT